MESTVVYNLLYYIMERLTKRYNERIGTYEYIVAFRGAGIFDNVLKGLSSKFVKKDS